MSLPSWDSCTEPATIDTSMEVRAHRRPHWYGVPAKLTTPAPSAACRALGVSRSWFYKWKDATLAPRAVRRQRLTAEVKRLFAAHDGKAGSPRITADLNDAGWRVSQNTVADRCLHPALLGWALRSIIRTLARLTSWRGANSGAKRRQIPGDARPRLATAGAA
jgi:HTH-like domain